MTDVEAAHLAPDATGVEATSTAVATTAGDLPQQRVTPSLQTLTGNSPGLRQLALDHAHCVGEARPVKDRAVECLCHTPPCLHGVIPRQLHRSLASQRPLRRPDPAGFTRSHAPELLWRFGHAPTSTPGLQRHSHLGLVAEPRSARATAADLPAGVQSNAIHALDSHGQGDVRRAGVVVHRKDVLVTLESLICEGTSCAATSGAGVPSGIDKTILKTSRRWLSSGM